MDICSIPGADTATILWHTGIHYGLAALVVTVGAIFLMLAVHAYRTSDTTSQRTDGSSTVGEVVPNAIR